ncbi:MAG: carboxymuconolactone decarboxylase [Solirubrobacterales bacterium]
MFKIIAVVINLALFIGIIYVVIKVVQGIKVYLAKNKQMDEKLDEIIKKLDDKN